MRYLSRAELVQLLLRPGVWPITLLARTVPEMRKTGNPHFGNCYKLATVCGWYGAEYADLVNQRRLQEGKPADFRPLPRRWGERYQGTALIVHGERLYLNVLVDRTLDAVYVTGGGDLIPDEAIRPYLSEKSIEGRQDVERPVIVRDYQLDNLLAVKGSSETFVLYGPARVSDLRSSA
jgi:hypothetical protein